MWVAQSGSCIYKAPGNCWDDRIKNASLSQILAETLTSVQEADTVGGNWCTDSKEITVWVNASSVATGVALETNGTFIENACWLRPINDAQHVNLSELGAALKGINLALQWEATVHRWISDTLSGRARVNTRAAAEMLVRRRLGTLQSLANDYGLTTDVKLYTLPGWSTRKCPKKLLTLL